jgi:molybdopterin converting factor small subunit
MENDKVAKFFIGTLLEQEIIEIKVKPQEYTYEGEFDFDNPEDVEKYENRLRTRHSIWVYRVDFIATVRTQTGETKKILIEIQKARNEIDLMRFRNYLADQYKRQDIVNGEKKGLPITTIYILGFNIKEIPTPCLKVERNYKDLTNNTTLDIKSEFVEQLTHDSYIVQVKRITNKYQTRLDKLLSIFEQRYFIDDLEIIKEFNHDTNDSADIKLITQILHHTCTDPTEKKRIETEQEAWRTIQALLQAKYKKFAQAAEDLIKANQEKKQAIEQKDIAIEQKDIAIEQKDIAIEQKDIALQALQEKELALQETNKALQATNKILQEKELALQANSQAVSQMQETMLIMQQQIQALQQR